MARPAAPERALRAARAKPPQAGCLCLPVRSLARRRNRSQPPRRIEQGDSRMEKREIAATAPPAHIGVSSRG